MSNLAYDITCKDIQSIQQCKINRYEKICLNIKLNNQNKCKKNYTFWSNNTIFFQHPVFHLENF